MKIIAIDTATDICGVSYLENGKIVHTVEENIPRQHIKSLPLFYEKLCSERAVEYLQSKPALKQFDLFEEPQVWEPKQKKLKERIQASIYTFVTYETAEVRILAKARFILECHAWRWVKQRNEKVWILPDDRKTKRPERAWKAWLRDYELKQKIQNEIENNCDL